MYSFLNILRNMNPLDPEDYLLRPFRLGVPPQRASPPRAISKMSDPKTSDRASQPCNRARFSTHLFGPRLPAHLPRTLTESDRSLKVEVQLPDSGNSTSIRWNNYKETHSVDPDSVQEPDSVEPPFSAIFPVLPFGGTDPKAYLVQIILPCFGEYTLKTLRNPKGSLRG